MMPGYHILHLIDHMGAGGAQRLLADIARRQVQRGMRVTLVCLRGATSLSRTLQAEGVDVRCLALHKADPRQVFALHGLLRTLRPALLHTHLTVSCLLGRVLGTAAGLPVVVHDHDGSAEAFIIPGPLLAFKRLVEVRLPQRGVRYVVISCSSLAYALAVRRLPERHVALVPNGIDVAYIEDGRVARDTARSALGLPSGVPLVAVLGRLAPEKGLDVLLTALPALPGVHLALAGRGPLEAALRSQARALGVARRTHFLGHLDDPRPVLWAADVYAQPSRREAFGLAAAEAAALGLSVVASRVGGLPDVVLDGVTGALVPPDDPGALALALAQMLEKPETLGRLGMAARHHARARFAIDVVLDRLERVYDDLLCGAGFVDCVPSGISEPEGSRAG